LCKLIICKILRPDKFFEFAIEFISNNLGPEFIPEGMPDVSRLLNNKDLDNNC